MRPGTNPIAVNWPGNERLSESNKTIRVALDSYCSGDASCKGNHIDASARKELRALHRIEFLDTEGQYSHFLGDSNEAICSPMFDFISRNAP